VVNNEEWEAMLRFDKKYHKRRGEIIDHFNCKMRDDPVNLSKYMKTGQHMLDSLTVWYLMTDPLNDLDDFGNIL